MPLVRISLRQGKSAAYRKATGDAVHQALVEAVSAPPLDRFQVITEHGPEGLIYDPEYLGIRRNDDVVFIQITLNAGRTIELKKALYARIVELLKQNPGVRPENVVINLLEVPRENWSYGNGIAQYVQ